MVETSTPEVARDEALPATSSGTLHLAELHSEPHSKLLRRADELRLRVNPERSRRQLIFDLAREYAMHGTVFIDGVLEMVGESHGFLRSRHDNFRPGADDPYVSGQLIQRFSLKNGHHIAGRIAAPRGREKHLFLEEITAIENVPSESWQAPPDFEDLTPTFPNRRIMLENNVTKSISTRAIDLVTPLGRGQRGLIVAPPRTGKTILLKEIAQAILVTSPDIRVILLLIDERPEEVTDLKRTTNAEIYSSTFDEGQARHVQIAELVSARARRIVETGAHVIILLDSITRLARGYNALQPGKGRTMSGGVESKALAKPKKFFSSARNIEGGGSLTILATALIETESRMDELIFEEFKGTGNMELHLDRGLVEKRIFPAIHVTMSGTRREELLYHPDEFALITLIRKTLAQLPAEEAAELLLRNIEATKTNAELLLAGLR